MCIRIAAFAFLPVMVAYMIASDNNCDVAEVTTLIDVVVVNVLLFIFYYRVGSHIRDISRIE